jgi:elongation factor P
MRPGTRVELEGEPHVILQYQHVKPGKGGAFVRLKLRSLLSGAVIDRTLRSGETLPQADVREREMQYLYAEGERLIFMDQQTYEQIEIAADLVEGRDLLPESCAVRVLLHNDRPIGVELPTFVVVEIAETDPAERGGKQKPATLATGAVIQVPSFLERGEQVRVDTRDRKYVERA